MLDVYLTSGSGGTQGLFVECIILLLKKEFEDCLKGWFVSALHRAGSRL
jgi:hypothetical protein